MPPRKVSVWEKVNSVLPWLIIGVAALAGLIVGAAAIGMDYMRRVQP